MTDPLKRLPDMDEEGIDVLIANTKHNVQYLLGGHRAFFFDYMDAMGVSRYLPLMIYAKGAPEKAAFFGHRLENFQRENHPFWVSVQQCNSSGSLDTIRWVAQKRYTYCQTLAPFEGVASVLIEDSAPTASTGTEIPCTYYSADYRYRAGVVSLFMAAAPISVVLGSPISSALLGMDGFLGLHGWQWMFLIEAAPGVFERGSQAPEMRRPRGGRAARGHPGGATGHGASPFSRGCKHDPGPATGLPAVGLVTVAGLCRTSTGFAIARRFGFGPGARSAA